MSEWIKCNDRMPPMVDETSILVLVWGDGFDTPEIDSFDPNEGWSYWGVTHWQQLPQPPEE
ncbi:DUF551 domain-containing protein [Haemophilus haemolyticus]|uniref:DUF551 domain-containing protein n=1 Tax=Haemophilus haemolyticus TaxID=726 RepID=UPI000E595F6C|nr:DUF551 domain-containing protein [Haemophilus haemolyticus]